MTAIPTPEALAVAERLVLSALRDHRGRGLAYIDEVRPAVALALAELRERQANLFTAIAHGDAEHRAWLEKAIADHFAGKPVEKPAGQNSAQMIAELREENRRLRELFDDAMDYCPYPDNAHPNDRSAIENLRKARAALTKEPKS